MKVCVAQIQSKPIDILYNINQHIKIINIAKAYNIDAIFFPELSLTGYEPQLIQDNTFINNDKRLDIFQQISNSLNITIGVGLPIQTKNGINIGMSITSPKQSSFYYYKSLLHEDELPFFNPRYNESSILKINDYRIGLGICYEATQKSHIDNIFNLEVDLYITSVAKHQKGINTTNKIFSHVSKQYSTPILMSNCIGKSDTFIGAGQSCAWSNNGQILNTLNDNTEGLLIYDTDTKTTTKLNF